jgi:hypothetical protein
MTLDLDVDTPEKVAQVLRAAAERFYESEGELQSAWQDRNAGRVWREFAKILERAADQCERAVSKYV